MKKSMFFLISLLSCVSVNSMKKFKKVFPKAIKVGEKKKYSVDVASFKKNKKLILSCTGFALATVFPFYKCLYGIDKDVENISKKIENLDLKKNKVIQTIKNKDSFALQKELLNRGGFITPSIKEYREAAKIHSEQFLKILACYDKPEALVKKIAFSRKFSVEEVLIIAIKYENVSFLKYFFNNYELQYKEAIENLKHLDDIWFVSITAEYIESVLSSLIAKRNIEMYTLMLPFFIKYDYLSKDHKAEIINFAYYQAKDENFSKMIRELLE